MFRSLRKLNLSTRFLLLQNHLKNNYSSIEVNPKLVLKNTQLKGSLDELEFINTAIKALPIDENPHNKTRQIRGYNYSKVQPTPRESPRLVSLSGPALELLDLDKAKVEKDPDSALYLSGNKIPSGSQPIAHCYCGHQFGSFAGQLGDGRAITLGDIKNNRGEIWELQLKGAGETPYSRFADGKAVLRSSVREYLCSEAMWALGIPTTRAASLVITDSLADRDQFYTGNVVKERCAVVLRLSPTFWRFGSFEIFRGYTEGREGPSCGLEEEMMPNMLNYILRTFYPEINQLTQKGHSEAECWFEMFQEIVKRTANLVALWQCYGFCHGVLNTDNMSVLGLTMDYGPFGWMDYFNRRQISNTSDQGGRYSYENQPQVCKWNLYKLAEALHPFIPFDKSGEYVKNEFEKLYRNAYYSKMREKLGFYCVESPKDFYLIDELFDLMHLNASDFTNTFRALSSIEIPKDLSQSLISSDFTKLFAGFSPDLEQIASRYKPRYNDEQIEKLKELASTNPELLLRIGITPEFVQQEEQNLKRYNEYLKTDEKMRKQEIEDSWGEWLKKYKTRLHLETLGLGNVDQSKDSEGILVKQRFKSLEELREHRIKRMNLTNPLYVLRNYMAEEAIRQAEKGDFSVVNNLLELLLNPFEERKEQKSEEYKKCSPKGAEKLCVSCSS